MSLRLSSFYPTNVESETVTNVAATQYSWHGSGLRLTVAMVLCLLGTMTQMFAGNTPSYGERMLDVFVPNAPLTCLSAGGTIGCGTLSGCAPFTPAAFTTSVLPSPSYASSGYPTLYKWAKSATATTYSSSNAAQWTVITGATSSTYTPSALLATTYFVRLANNAACATLVCSNVLKATVTTCATCNNITAAGTISASTPLGCLATTTFDPRIINSTALPTGGTGTIEYVWLISTNGGTTFTQIAGATAASYDPAPISVTTFYRRCARRSGCTAYVGESNWVTISVNAAATVSVSVSASTVCSGTSTTLTASGCASYRWSTNATTASISVAPTATTTYTVTATNTRGCTVTAIKTITVNTAANLTLDYNLGAGWLAVANGNVSACLTRPLHLSANPDGWTSYRWTGPNGFTATGNANGDVTVSTAATAIMAGTYNVTATFTNGCTKTASVNVAVNNCTNCATTPYTTSVTATPATITAGGNSTLAAAGGAVAYIWSNGQASAAITVSPSATTTYTVTATANTGCTATASLTVTVGSVCNNVTNAGSIGTSQTVCATSFDPPLITSVALPSGGGTGTIEYVWLISTNGGSTFTSIAGANGSTYDPGVITQSTCFRRCSRRAPCTAFDGESNWVCFTLNAPAGVNITKSNDLTCTASSATLTASGCASYVWSNGATTAATSVIAAGTYTVTATASNGCTATASVTVAQTGANATVTNAGAYPTQFQYLCSTGGNLAASVISPSAATCSAGAPSYQWQIKTDMNGAWSNVVGATSASYDPGSVAPGSRWYRRLAFCGTCNTTGTPATGWSAYDIHVSNLGVTASATPTSYCASSAPASVSLNATVTDPMTLGTVTYAWSNGGTSATATISPAPTATTTYTVTVTKAIGTSVCTKTANVTVTVNPAPDATATSATICQGQTATLTAGGGGTYAWSNGTTGSTVTSTTAGTFTVTVTGANGCTKTATGVVTVNPLPTAAITGNTQIFAGQSTTLTATGGTSYAWSNGATTAANTVTPTVTTTYTVTVTNANGCTKTASVTVTVTPIGSIGDKVFADIDADGIQDAGENGVQGVTATLYNGTTVVATTTTDANGNYLFNNLPAGAYTVGFSNIPVGQFISPVNQGGNDNIDSDANSTTGQTGVINLAAGQNITDVDAGLFAKVTLGDKVFADADGDGIQGAGENGVPGVTVTLYDSNNNPIATTTTDANGNYSFPNLNPGTYSVGFTGLPTGTVLSPANQGGNPANDSDANPTTGRSNPVTLTSGQTNNTIDAGVITCGAATATKSGDISCTNTSATLTATGGNTYAWSNGANTATTSVTTAGTYTVTATSTNGCIKTASVSVSANTTAPTASITGGDAPLTCAVSSATLTAAGGGSYAWSNGATTAATTVSAAATYTVTVTSANGCIATASKIVTSDNSAPVVTVTNPTICAMGSTNVVATGGGTYAWSGGEVTASIWAMPAATTTFTVTVTATNGCTATAAATVTVNPLPAVTATSSAASVCAAANTVTLTATGATSYAWNTGATTASITANPTTNTTYTVTGTDANGCTKTATVAVTVTPCCNVTNAGSIGVAQSGCGAFDPAMITSIADPSGGEGAIEYVWLISTTGVGGYTTIPGANSSTYDPGVITQTTWFRRCSRRAGCSSFVGESNDIIMTVNPVPTASITGGDAPLTCTASSATLTAAGGASYAWSNGATTAATTITAAGTYTVTVTSAAGCTATASKTVTSDNSTPLVTVTNPTICAMGSTNVVATGGGTYAWSGGETTASIWAMPAATETFTVTVTAANGCTASAQATVTVNPLPTMSVTNATVCTGNSATITASGATSYAWSNGAATAAISTTTVGTYTVTGTDANGCSKTATGVISNYPAAIVSATNATVCIGANATITASGATTYAWSDGSTAATLTSTTAGTYTVTGTDANGCTATAQGVIGNYAAASATATAAPSTINAGSTTDLTATGGVSYAWSNGTTSVTISVTPASTTTYTVTATDANGCTAIATVTVTVNALGSIGDKVFADTDRDGIQDAGESGIPNVTVTLYDAANNVVATTTTDANGNYIFNNIPTGTYTVGFGTPSGFIPSPIDAGGDDNTDSDAGAGGISAPITLGAGQTVTNVDAGFYPSCDNVTNAGLIGTAQSGCGSFDPAALTSITDPSGGQGALEIVWLVSTDGFVTYSVIPGANGLTYDPGVLTQTTWFRRCARRAGCTAFVGESNDIKITVSPAFTGIHDMTQNATCGACNGGIWIMYGGGTAPYTFTIDGAAAASSYGPWFNAAINQYQIDIYGQCAGAHTVVVTDALGCTFSFTSTITNDAAPVATATSANNLSCSATSSVLTATGGGTYSWSNGANTADTQITTAGTYTVTVTNAAGCTATASVNVTIDNTVPTATVTGGGVICVGASSTLTATGGGTYSWNTGATTAVITTTTAGIYTTIVTSANGCTASATAEVTTGVINPGTLAGGVVICGTSYDRDPITATPATCPAGNPAYQWQTMTSTSAWTDIAGATGESYDPPAQGLGSNWYRRMVTCQGCADAVASTPGYSDVHVYSPTVTIAASAAGVCAGSSSDLTATPAGTYANATIAYAWSNGGTAATTSVTAAGTYTVTITDGSLGCTATASVTIANSCGSIGDKVFADTNADGVQQGIETGVAGVTVTLYNGATVVGTTTTDANGNYSFSNLPAGAYTVNFSGLAAGAIFSPANQGGDDNTDSDADATTGTTGVINLANGQNITDVDAGVFSKATVGDKVFADLDGNGIQDAGEAGILGVTVTLYDSNNNVVATTTTDANGNYSFANVNPGTYTIGFTNGPAGSTFSPANQGGNPANDSNAGTNGVTAPFTVGSGETNNTIDAGLVPAPCLVRPMSNAVATCNGNVYGFYYNNELWTVVDGSMKELADGTATIAATYANGTQQVVVTVNLSGKTYTAGVGSPKFGVCVNNTTNNWYYYPTYTGTLQFSNGTSVNIVPMGPALQVGIGGNLNDASVFGASAWFQDATTGQYLGDFNFSLGTAVPCVTCNQVTSAGSIAASQAACGGFDPALITSVTAPSGGTGALEFVWLSSTDGGTTYSIIPGANGLTYNPGPITQTTWFRRCSRRAGCSAYPGESNWLQMTVNPIPTASVTGNTTICAGTSGTLTAAGGATFAWSTGETTAAITVSPAASTAYTVTVTSAEGCTASTFVGVQVNTFAGLTGTNAAVCAGTAATVGFADASATYAWNTGAATATISVSPAATTTYTATITAANGCVATGTVVVTVNAVPAATASSAISCAGANVIITATGGGTYAWSNGAATADLTTATAGTYTVTVTSAEGCSATATGVVTTGVIDPGVLAGGVVICATSYDRDPITATAATCPAGNPAYQWQTMTPTSAWTDIPGATGESYNPPAVGLGSNWYRRLVTCQGCADAVASTPGYSDVHVYSPTVTIATAGEICANTNATVTLTATAAGTYNGTVAYAWSNGSTGATSTATAAGVYTVTITDGVIGCSSTASVTVSDVCTAKLGDTVFNDADANGVQNGTEAGVAGVTVTLYNGTTIVATTSTDANGNYLFTNLPAGTYTVGFTTLPTGFIFTGQNAGTDDTIDSDADATGVTAPIVLANGETILTVDAGVRGIGSIGDKVFSDTNGDGIQDAGELGVAGVTVTLYNGTTVVGTTTTDANGNYIFSGVSPGTYTVQFTNLPNGFVFSPSNVGTNDDNDSDADATGTTQPITLGAGQNITSIDAGIRGQASLGNFVFADANGNGIQDAGETGVPNITVTLYNGTTIVGTTTTDANGAYSFTNLLPGSYTVNFSNTPANTVFSPINQGGDDTIDSDVDAVTGTTGTITLVAGDNNTTVDAGIAPCPTPSITGTATICVGASTTLTAAGGGTYLWSNGETTDVITASPTATTVYTVNVTSAAGCVRSTTITVVVNPVPNVSVNGNAVICAGGSTALTSSATGTYAWSNGETASSIVVSPAANTTYTVTVTNGFGCSAAASVEVVVNPNPVATATSIAICQGNSGTITADGGSAYAWNTGAATASIVLNPSATTTYTVTVTSGANCSATATAVVTVNDNPVASITCKNVVCLGEVVEFTAAGGVSYLWSNGQTTATFSDTPLVTATYTVTVTNAAGCTATATRLVTVNPAATAAITGTAVICNGASTTLTATGSGTYAWSNGSNQAAQTLSPTANTTYTVTVTNAYGCTATSAVAVTVNDAANANIAGSGAICFGSNTILTASGNGAFAWSTAETTAAITVAPTATTVYTVTVTTAAGCTTTATKNVIVNPLPNTQIAGSAAICIGNSTTLTASGGGFYRWNTGATTAALLVTPTATTTYTVTATSGAGCKQSSTFVVTVNALPVANITGTTTICTGTSTTLTADGGANYAWSDGSTTPSNTVSPTATTTYTVTVTSGASCSTTRSVTVTVNPLPTPEITGGFVICAGQSTALTAIGGTAYAWSNGTATATNMVTPLSSTTYTVTVTNSNNCTATVSKYVTVNALPTPFIAGENVICLGKTATLSVIGGVSYMWDNGVASAINAVSPTVATTYTVTATSAEGCTSTATYLVNVNALPVPTIVGRNTICLGKSTTLTAGTGDAYAWNTGDNTAAITVSPAATTTYVVTATNANGCTQTTAATVTVNALPVLTVTAPTAICINYTATLTAGTGDAYAWDNGATTASITVAPTTTTTYSVTATNLLGCTATESRTVIVNSLTLAPMTNATVCNGITATVGYTDNSNTYAWTNGAATASISVAPANTTTYTVTATNSVTGCTYTASVTVIVNQLPVITFETPFVICNTEGADIVAIAGANDQFIWSTGASTANIHVDPSATTTYSVTATTPEGCKATASTVLTVNPLPTIRIAGTTTICNTFSTTLTADGGVAYYWETGDETAAITVSPTATTTYTVTVTSAEGCASTQSITVTVNPLPVPSITGTTVVCFGGTANLTAAGGVSYVWSNGVASAVNTVTPTATTTYTVTVTNGFGCSLTKSETVTVNPLPVVAFTGTTTLCAGNGTTITASGGVTYLWSNTQSGAALVVTPPATATYTVTATTALGCTATKSLTITVNPTPTASVAGTLTICNGQSTTLNTTTSATTATYAWSNGASTAAITVAPSANTIYTVTITNEFGCTKTAQAAVRVNAVPVVTFVNTQPLAICAGACTLVCAQGGVSYAWNTAQTAATITVCPTETTSYTVTATNSRGCTATGIIGVTVNPLPVATVSTTNATACVNDNVTLTAAGGSTFAWSNGATTAAITTVATTTTTYVVTVTATGGCTATASQTIIVNPRTTVVAACSNSGQSICIGSNFNLNASPSASNAANAYAWAGPNGFTSNQQFPQFTNVTAAMSGTYTVTLTNEFGCTSTANATLNIALCDTKVEGLVFDDANQNGVNDGGSEPVLTGVTVQLLDAANTVVQTLVSDAFGYSFSNVIPGTYTVQFSNLPSGYVFTAQNAGSSNGSDANASGVTPSFTVAPGIDVVDVDAGAFAGGASIGDFVWFDANADGLQAGETGIAGVVVTLYDNLGTQLATTTTDGSGFYTFPVAAGSYSVGFYRAGWELTSQTNNTGSGSDANPTTGRTMTFAVTTGQNKNDIDAGFKVCTCRAAAAPNLAQRTTAPADASNLRISRNAVSVYPNPSTSDELTVKVFTTAEGSDATIVVMDVTGKQVLTQKTVLASGTNYVRLDVNAIPTGTYFVKVLANGINFEAQKLVRIAE